MRLKQAESTVAITVCRYWSLQCSAADRYSTRSSIFICYLKLSLCWQLQLGADLLLIHSIEVYYWLLKLSYIWYESFRTKSVRWSEILISLSSQIYVPWESLASITYVRVWELMDWVCSTGLTWEKVMTTSERESWKNHSSRSCLSCWRAT